MDKEVYFGLEKVFNQQLDAALITVTSVLGSTPRKSGAKMLVLADGTTFGTIGGGCGEAEGRREALNVIASYTSKIYHLNMTADIAQEEGMVCGGVMELFIDYLGFQNPIEQINLYKEYLSAIKGTHYPTIVTVIKASDEQLIGRKLFIKNTGQVSGDLGLDELSRIAQEIAKIGSKNCQQQLISFDSEFEPWDSSVTKAAYRLLVEPSTTVEQLLILGAGHIALPLATMAKIIGYEVTVVDDRPSFANSARFPTVDTVICNDFELALDAININMQTLVVIITRGHRYDKVCLRKVINQPALYIGMIGSRKRVKALLTELEEEGVSREALQRIYSPIGLKIGAETPEEIAISILSELIKVQKGI